MTFISTILVKILAISIAKLRLTCQSNLSIQPIKINLVQITLRMDGKTFKFSTKELKIQSLRIKEKSSDIMWRGFHYKICFRQQPNLKWKILQSPPSIFTSTFMKLLVPTALITFLKVSPPSISPILTKRCLKQTIVIFRCKIRRQSLMQAFCKHWKWLLVIHLWLLIQEVVTAWQLVRKILKLVWYLKIKLIKSKSNSGTITMKKELFTWTPRTVKSSSSLHSIRNKKEQVLLSSRSKLKRSILLSILLLCLARNGCTWILN